MLTTTVQLHYADTNKSHMVIHDAMINKDISLERVFQKHLSDPTHAHGLIDHVKDRKRASKRKWTEREYHVQENKYVQYKSVKISCDSTQFCALLFCGTYAKPHGVIGLSKHYNFQIDPK